jgi:hypothetical protein
LWLLSYFPLKNKLQNRTDERDERESSRPRQKSGERRHAKKCKVGPKERKRQKERGKWKETGGMDATTKTLDFFVVYIIYGLLMAA